MIAQLNDLLDAELNSVFAFLGHSTPYLDRSHASLRKPLELMIANSQRRIERLVELIEALGGSPIARGLQSGEQHLAYLSIHFLLPRLMAAKRHDIERYRQVRASCRGDTATAIDEMIIEQQNELMALEKG